MKKTPYKRIIELEDYYKDMKKKYTKLDMWDILLDFLDKQKRKYLSKRNINEF